MKQKRIKVTGRHIDEGAREAPEACPIAQALLARKNVVDVFVEPHRAEICERLKHRTVTRTYELPSCATEFISTFDAGKPVKPFSFKLGALLKESEE